MTRFFSYSDLVKRLVDFDRLTAVPFVGERTALVSSYDRASVYDEASDRYVNWGANADGTGFVRQEGENQVLAEIPGPGCIWRIWAATAGEGAVRIYLDGATEPAIDLPFAGYFDGNNEPFNRPNLVYTTAAMGYNNYTPIPFQTSCKIVAAPGWGKYYHFNYTIFPAKTRLRTFKRHLTAEDASALDAVDRKLGRCGDNPEMQLPRGHQTTSRAVEVAAGSSEVVADLREAGEIIELRVKVDLPPEIEAQRRRLRELTLAITWDDEAQPAVWSPLGDFFGCAAGAVPFRTLAAGLRDDGTFYCFWRMPFATRVLVSVNNESAEPVAMTWEVVHAPLSRSIDSYLRFHAKWHRDVLPVRADRAPDWTLLQTQGTGRYVGTQLHVWNPRGGWWGEGDEKFFVDGEKFPSTFGTGAEDYFGYAWSSGKTFVQALHSQPVNQENRGHVSVNRWHLSDDVPFQTQFEGSIEKYFPNLNPCEFAAVAYWYLSPGGVDPFGEVPVAERIGPWVWPEIVREEGVIEAEELRVVKEQWPHATSELDAVARGIPAGVASNDRVLIWWVDRAGYRLELGGFKVETTGRYRVYARFVCDYEMGRFKFDFDGVTFGGTFDLYAPTKESPPRLDRMMDLGVFDLTEGEHVFGAETQEKNPESAGFLLCVDYFKLVRIHE